MSLERIVNRPAEEYDMSTWPKGNRVDCFGRPLSRHWDGTYRDRWVNVFLPWTRDRYFIPDERDWEHRPPAHLFARHLQAPRSA